MRSCCIVTNVTTLLINFLLLIAGLNILLPTQRTRSFWLLVGTEDSIALLMMTLFLNMLIATLLVASIIAQEETCPYKNRGWSIEHWPMNTDQSESCQSCTTFFRQEQAIWCNDTSVKKE